ncbi:MAG: SIR2 family NAD-dependent protein deacylase [Verrucomicrobiales bacterium]
MPKPPINHRKVLVFTGAGISAPSGIATFRGSNGLWRQHRLEDVATPEAWSRQAHLVLEFYNERRAQAAAAQPNAAHKAIVDLQQRFEVVVVTQNVDDLHERAGSTHVIHLHGELRKARSTADSALVYDIGGTPIHLGDACAAGSQLRPHIVWFGEEVMNYDQARSHILDAGRVLVVGTSLAVYPAAGILRHARHAAKKVIVDVVVPKRPYGFKILKGSADSVLPALAETWMKDPIPDVV